MVTQKSKIYSSLDILGTLENVGGVLVDYVYFLAPTASFERTKSVGEEWKLTPKSWIVLQFSKGWGAPKIHISLDVYRSNLEDETNLELKPGRIERWTKVTIVSVSEIPEVLKIIKFTHNVSG